MLGNLFVCYEQINDDDDDDENAASGIAWYRNHTAHVLRSTIGLLSNSYTSYIKIILYNVSQKLISTGKISA